MKVRIKHDTLVRFSKETIVEVPEDEARRLLSLGNAEIVKEEKPKKKGK